MLKKISIRGRYLISFGLVLIVIFLFSSGLYESYRWNNLNYVDVASLERFTYAADGLSQIMKSMDTLVSFSRVEDLWLKDEETGKPSLLDSSVFSLLENLQSKLAEGVEALYFERGSAFLYTAGQKLRYHEYEKMRREEYDLAMSQFYTHICKETSNALIPILKRDGSSGAIARIVPIDTGEKQKSCSLVFILPRQLIMEELERYLGTVNGDFYAYDQRYVILFSLVSDDENHIPFHKLVRHKGSGVQNIDDTHVMLSVTKADAGLHFLLCESKENFYASVEHPIRSLALKIVLLSLLLILLYVWQFVFSYMPIRKLASELTGSARKSYRSDEIEIIKSSYNKNVEEVEKLSGQVLEMTPLALQHFLSRWVSRHIPDIEAFSKLSSYTDVVLPFRFYVVLCFSLPSGTDVKRERTALRSTLKRFHMQNHVMLCGELVEESSIFMIVNFKEQSSTETGICSIGEAVRSFLGQNGFEDVRIGVGSAYEEPLKVPESFREAGAALQISRHENSAITYYGTWQNQSNSTAELSADDFPPMLVSLLVGSIGRADSQMARRALSDLIKHIRKEADSVLYYRFFSGNLLKLMLDEAKNNHIQYSQADLHFLLAVNSIDEFEDNIYQFVDKLCSQIGARQALSATNRHDRLMNHILNHYKDFSMSIQSVSEAVEIPCADITHIIKDEVGLNFVQYVSYLRMNEFKRLLLETDRTISELVGEIGYSDVSNFLRKFKNAEGMTAGQYREKYASGKQANEN